MSENGSLSAKDLAAFLERMGKQLGLADQKTLLEQALKELRQIRGILADIKSQSAKASGEPSEGVTTG